MNTKLPPKGKFLLSGLTLFFVFLTGFGDKSAENNKSNSLLGQAPEITKHTLWNSEPAQDWISGFPVGNGRLGSIIQGFPNDLFIINEDTLWESPKPRDILGSHQHLEEIRRLIADESYVEAEALVEGKFLTQRGSLANRPLCKLQLDLHPDQKTESYRRSLDMATGITSVVYEKAGDAYRRDHFVSFPDQVWVMHFSSDADLGFKLDVSGFTELEFGSEKNVLFFKGETEPGGTKFAAAISVVSEKGIISYGKGSISVKGGNAAEVLLTVGTDYYGEDPMEICRSRMEEASRKTYDELKATHVSDHQALYDRVDLQLGETSSLDELSTGERIARLEQGGTDPFLDAQFYQLSRYLIIASSRPGDMPAHLHGLWIMDFAPKYNCAYHLNVNIQMNYWPAEVGNLSELHVPFFDFIDALRENGRITAREHYNCDGFVVHHNVDGSLVTGPFGKAQWGFWPMGHVWACQNLWEHYLFTGDKKFLREKGYPILKEAAEFVYDYLMENPESGQLIFGPSTSPENFYETEDGESARVMTGIAMDQQLTWDLFTHCIQAVEDLGLKDPFTDKLSKALSRLEKSKIGEDGRILEWRRPLKEASPEHRHLSHLFGAFPGDQFTPEHEPELYAASIKSLEARIEARELVDFKGPAWAKAYSMLLWARFHRPEDAYAAYLRLYTVRGDISDNLFAAFSKNRVIMDANGGGGAGIAEMLLQSHRGFVEFLPACPDVWDEGSFRGLKTRGGFEIDLEWSKGNWKKASVKSLQGNPFRLETDSATRVYRDGKPVEIKRMNGISEFQTESAATYSIVHFNTPAK